MSSVLRSRFAGPALLLLAVIVANYNVVFLGQSLVATANYHPFDYRPTHLYPGQAQGIFPRVNWNDLGVAWWQWEPAGKLFSKEFRAGRVPFWDSDVGGGVDAHVALQHGQYYPPYILLLLAGDTPVLRDIYYLLEVFASGLFCYLLLRNYGCHPVSAVAMGVAYMLGGSLTQNVNSIEGQSVAVLPAMVWAIDQVLRHASWRWAGAASLILATAALSSFLPIVISGYVLVGIFVLVSLIWQAVYPEASQARFEWRRWVRPAAAIVVSALLVAFLMLPVRAASRQDQTFASWYRGLGVQHYPFDRLLTLLSPSVSFEVNQTSAPAQSELFNSTFETSFFYVGLIPILLSFLAIPKVNPGMRRLRVFFLIATVFLLLKLVGMPPAQWIAYLPVFHDLHFMPYFCGALNFSIAGLAALGVEKLIREPGARSLSIGMMACVGVFICILRFAQTEPINPMLQGSAIWSAVAHYGLEIARLALLAGAFIAVLALRGRNSRGVTTGTLMLTLMFLDLAPLAARTRFLRSDVWAEPPEYVRFLQRDHGIFRVHGTHELTLTADVSQAFGLQVLSSRESFNSSRFDGIARKYFAAPDLPYPLAASLLPSARPLLDLLNVKYLILFSPNPQDLQQVTAAGFSPKFQDGLFEIFQNQTVWDRAYLAKSASVQSTPELCLEGLASLRPGDVLLEQQPSPETLAISPPGTVESIQYDFDRITIRVRAERPALLVLDENYSPGWHATVQGRPVTIQHANYAFQAVTVPQGTSEVKLHYVPVGLYPGLAVTGLGILLATAMLLWPFPLYKLS